MGRLVRPELSIKISEALFRELLPEATRGATFKLRYGIPGYVFSEGGARTAVVLQLDEVWRAGKSLRWLDRPLFRADLEIPCEQLAHDVRAGRSSFAPILRQCAEVSRLPKNVVREISYKNLARRGCTQEMLRTHEDILSRDRRG